MRAVAVATPVLRLTRAVFVLGVCLTAGTGVALYTFPDRTADYWAWTIAAEPSAAFFGAGYLGAAVALALAAREREWRQARPVAVLAFTLTSLALLVTLRNLGPFAFEAGGVTGAIAWIWLAVYVALPPLVFTAFVLQERAGGRHEHGGEQALAATRFVLGGAGVVAGAVGLALLAGWDPLEARWPWPLTPLSAGVVGGWLSTFGVGFLWFALREGSWRRSRIAVIATATTAVLDLLAAARLRDGFGGGLSSAVYVVTLAVLLAAIGVAGLVEERRLSGP
jgi:hypothetical protein